MQDSFWYGFVKKAEEDKVESPEKEKSSLFGGAAKSGVGGALMYHSADPLTGKVTAYHGSSPENIAKIKREGLKARKGGTGASKVHDPKASEGGFQRQSKGKIHVTRARPIATSFSMFSNPESELSKSRLERRMPHVGKVLSEGVKDRKNVVKINLTQGMYDKMEADPHMGNKKFTSATTTRDIPANRISGSKGYLKQRLKDLKELPSYVKSHPGRFARGVAGTVGGAYLLHKGVKGLWDKYSNPDNQAPAK